MCLIATNVAARGIDIPETDLIIQLSPPKDIDTYVHRSGRTARAGRKGVCITFYTQKDQEILKRIERKTNCKFRFIGAPQSKDILKSQARDISESLKTIKPEVLDMFEDIAEEMIQELGAKNALKRALAHMCG
jgi:ATP-dependent RNA helicase DDX21